MPRTKGSKVSEEGRRNMSIARRKFIEENGTDHLRVPKNQPRWTPEAKARLSEKMKERWKNRKRSGWTLSEETKEQISTVLTSLGMEREPEHCEALSRAMKSLWDDPVRRAEQIQKIKEGMARRKGLL